MPDIFLSYSRDDQATARRFAEGFEREGFSVWWDQTLSAGEAYDEVTEKALNEAKAVVVLWSKTSVVSRWVRAEATQANGNKTLVPVMIEPCKRPIMFELTHTAELGHWQGGSEDRAWLTFLGDVRRFVEGNVASTQPGPVVELAVLAQMRVTAAPDKLSVAVLPFANMSGDAEQEYFADGISEDIITDLSKVSALSVVSRNSAFTFKGKHVDLPDVARRLQVTHVLEGSVRKSGSRVRITAQLIDGATNKHIWAERYDRDLSDIFALQDEIAQAIVTALKLMLFLNEKQAIEERGTGNVDAYDKYLRARAFATRLGPSDVTRAVELYREALEQDPNFALAWYGLYSALANTQIHVPEKSARAHEEMAEASARMLELAPDAWWTQAMRANQFALQRNWLEAEAAASAAIASAPASEVDGFITYGTILGILGRMREAVEHRLRARQADPLSLGVSGGLQMSLDMAGRRAEAQAEYERSRDLPGSRALWEILALLRLWAQEGAEPAAVEAQFRLFLKHENLPIAVNQTLATRLFDKEAALVAIRQAFEDSANQDSSRMWCIAQFADHYGDKDLAFAAIRRMLAMSCTLDYTIWWPWETGLRADPRFKEILRDLGLVDYYRASGKWGDFCKPVGKDDFECH